MTTPLTRRGFVGLLGTAATIPLLNALPASLTLLPPTRVGRLDFTKNGFIYHLGRRTYAGDWRIQSRDGRDQRALETEVSNGRWWATDDGKPVKIVCVQWADDQRGEFGGLIMTYSNWRKGHGVGDEIGWRSFSRQLPIRVLYVGDDPYFAALKEAV